LLPQVDRLDERELHVGAFFFSTAASLAGAHDDSLDEGPRRVLRRLMSWTPLSTTWVRIAASRRLAQDR